MKRLGHPACGVGMESGCDIQALHINKVIFISFMVSHILRAGYSEEHLNPLQHVSLSYSKF